MTNKKNPLKNITNPVGNVIKDSTNPVSEKMPAIDVKAPPEYAYDVEEYKNYHLGFQEYRFNYTLTDIYLYSPFYVFVTVYNGEECIGKYVLNSKEDVDIDFEKQEVKIDKIIFVPLNDSHKPKLIFYINLVYTC